MRARSKKTKLNWFVKLLLALNIFAALSLILSYLAAVISPAVFWPIAFVGLAYPFLLLINLVFAAFWLFKKPAFALISFLTIIAGWKFLVSTVGFRETTAIQVPKSSDDLIRVMTWNVHYFKRFDDTDYEQALKDQMIDIIRKEQPDVFCVQEFFSRKKGAFNFEKALVNLLKTQHYYIEPQAQNDYEMNGYAIFSKYKITNKGMVNFRSISTGNQVLFADIKVKNKKIRVYNAHLQSINFQPEDYEYLKNVKEIHTDVSSTKRLSKRMKYAFVNRAEQVKVIKEHASDLKIPYIIAGDFNDTPVSYSVNTLLNGMQNTFREKGSGFAITYNGEFPNFQIDYILAGPEFEVVNYNIIDKKLSDHYPVRSDLRLK